MKKHVLSLLACAAIMSNGAWAQSVPNGAFETWSVTPYDDPTGWFNSNREALKNMNMPTTTKVAGITGSAIKIQTVVIAGDTQGGFFANTNGDPTNGEGGVPYSQKPSQITGKYMANMMGNDSAVMLVIFKKAGAVVSMNFFTLGGKNQTTFSSFSFPLTLAVVPDSVVIAAASSNLLTNVGVSDGSSIVFDDLAFAGTGITQTIPNGNFDAWTTKSIDKATGWKAFGEGVSRVTDSYKGTYAIRLETMKYDNNNVEPSGLTSGNDMGGGGLPFTNQQDTLFGYYKYTTSGNDSAMISAGVSKNGTMIGGNMMHLGAKATYTYFELPINAGAVPDSLRIDVMSSVYPTISSSVGSVLILDELQLKSQKLTTGIVSAKAAKNEIIAFPNPVSNVLNIVTNTTDASRVIITDLTGKVVMEHAAQGSRELSIQTSDLKPGVYFYQVEAAGQVSRGKFVKE